MMNIDAEIRVKELLYENARLREKLDIWIGIGARHIYQGECPEPGFNSMIRRDPDCPACRRLIELGD